MVAVKETTILRLDRFEPVGPTPEAASSTLTTFVLAVACSTTEPLVQTGNAVGTSPKSMLALMTYCYARGIYGSTDIEYRLRKGGSYIPNAGALQRFRRLNRATLLVALQKVLGLVHGSGNSTHIEIPVANEALLIRHEAERKVEIAALLDMSLNE